MKIQDLFHNLSVGEFSNLSLGNNGGGTILEEEMPKIVVHLNAGLLALYGRFLLRENDLVIELVEHITNYHLIEKYAESRGSEVRWPYIKDLPDDPFRGDVIKILSVFGQDGTEYRLNDKDDPNSLMTPGPTILMVPRPVHGRPLAISYQARYPAFDPRDSEILDKEFELPFVLEDALQSYIAYKVYSNMNGQENLLRGQEHLNTFNNRCAEVEALDLVNTTFATSHHKLDQRGFS